MYIEDRLFSETTDEVLYSVTMTEDEYDLFSEFQKEFADKLKLMKATLAPGALKVGNKEQLMQQAQEAVRRTSGNHKAGFISRPPSDGLTQLKNKMLGI